MPERTTPETPLPPEPPRLALGDDEVGRLLRGAEAEFRQGLERGSAFQRLERARRLRSVRSVLVGTAGLTLALSLVTHALRRHVVSPAAFSARAEPATSMTPVTASSRPAREALPLPEPSPASLADAKKPAADARALQPTEGACKALAANAKPERAVECYRALARETGIVADVALYNAARLEFDKLGDAQRALAFADEHRRRFPRSSLAAERDWLRVQSLEASGRSAEALRASDALLATPAGALLSADLHGLRARIDEDRGDCAAAVTELTALVGEPGERGDDAEFSRARCLEKSGRGADARAAYVHYLERSGARHGAEARARLDALAP